MKRLIEDNKIDAYLKKYIGSFAQIWLFGVTHKKLVIRLTFDGENNDISGEALYILCASCEYINGPFAWNNSNIELEIEALQSGSNFYKIKDVKNDFELACIGGIGLAIGPETEIDQTFDDFLRLNS